jgi:hypothetical protein
MAARSTDEERDNIDTVHAVRLRAVVAGNRTATRPTVG